MKKFSFYIFVRIITAIIILYILDVLYTSIYIHKKGVRNKIEFIFQNENKNYDYIFLGSSRVEFHVDTDLINKKTNKKSLNLGVSGKNLTETFLTLKLINQKNIKAKKYFIQIDEADVKKNRKKSFAQESYFLPYIKNKEIDNHLEKYDIHYLKDTKIPFYRYMNYGYKIGYREIILKLIDKNRDKNFFIGLETILNNEPTPYKFKDKYSTELLKEMAKYGKEKNIDLYFYIAPYYSVKNDSIFKKELKKHNIISYIDSVPNLQMYKDNGHLNKYGANVFTKMLIRNFKLK